MENFVKTVLFFTPRILVVSASILFVAGITTFFIQAPDMFRTGHQYRYYTALAQFAQILYQPSMLLAWACMAFYLRKIADAKAD